MQDLRSILTKHSPRKVSSQHPQDKKNSLTPTTSEIPDLFFDDVLVRFKLSRSDILVLMTLYRVVWCRPNLHRKYGIGPILSHGDLAKNLGLEMDELYQSIRKLESFGFIETIRLGQYFVRKYFTEENDKLYNQSYDDFY